ncbi:hypothetical protein J2S74_002851 [Evansella vedderi]|uniref:Uncharacterized protein n=1 Tax=Evansella vedderi TaxID=38282 RepID=A0ABT9ZW71_9BACI|nr:hypothetical protein [Evansella vedderi]MDQ0255469.1 hypothetical protein [Evansella vedderi]
MIRILDLLTIKFKLQQHKDQEIIQREINKYIDMMPKADKTGVDSELEGTYMQIVDLYTKALSAPSSGEKLVYMHQLEQEIEKIDRLKSGNE